MAALAEVAPGVLVHTSALYATTSTLLLDGRGGCVVVDPAITPADLDDLAAATRALGLTVTEGFATHPHWDHLLWSAALGQVPRHATAPCAAAAAAGRDALWQEAEAAAPGHDRERFDRLTPLTEGAAVLPWAGPTAHVVAHGAHAPGHAALLLPATGVLVCGDMLSDVEVPLLDLEAADPLGGYRQGLDTLAAMLADVRVVVPGHGRVGDAQDAHRRLAADRRYLDELERGGESTDPRLGPAWLRREHEAQRARLHR